MSLADLSVKRPTFITCIIILMLTVGWLFARKLPVDLFPNIQFPIVFVSTIYPGAGPDEVETLVSKVLEDQVSTVSGIKSLRSISKEGVSILVAEFSMGADIKDAEQGVRERISAARNKLPDSIMEPIIRRLDPSEQPILILALTANLPQGELYDLASEVVRTKLEQVNQVGLVDILGGRKREIHVELDREKLKEYEVSAGLVSSRIGSAGQNVPAGKKSNSKTETLFRTVAEFSSIKDIESTVINFFGNDVPVTLGQIAKVTDNLQDETSRTYIDNKPALTFQVFRQSGSNTVQVADSVIERIAKINDEIKNMPGFPEVKLVRDGSKGIRVNLLDVKESITIGIILTIVVVFLFLGSGRSTIITGLALPNSLLGAFILMAMAGFTINIMTLLALSLSVGLLVDDAIVVRENIFRHIEMGKSSIQAALDGTKEVSLAVIATTLTIVAVFGPIAFLQGMIGQFFKEFGLTICFAIMVSLFDALTIAPMMSAYFVPNHEKKPSLAWRYTFQPILSAFNRFQNFLELIYVHVLKFTVKRPLLVILAGIVVFLASMSLLAKLPKTFLPAQDMGEFSVSLEMPAGTSLEAMDVITKKVSEKVSSNKEVKSSVTTVGTRDGESHLASIFVELVDSKKRTMNTGKFKEIIRSQLKDEFAEAIPAVEDFNPMGTGDRPFNVSIIGNNTEELEKYSAEVFALIKDHPGLKDPELSQRPGKPEFQVVIEEQKSQLMGVAPVAAGAELRNLIEGTTPAVFRQLGKEYDIRVRLKESQRDLKEGFSKTYIPNVNNRLVPLQSISKPVERVGPATVNRQDRGRYIQISADLATEGPGMGEVMADLKQIFEKDHPLPQGMRYRYVGQAESFAELLENMLLALGLGILFIYLVLASLYESFVTPFTIMLVLPLAVCGAVVALFVTGKGLDLFSMIGCILLMGIATKNSILLVDYANQLVAQGKDRSIAIIESGRVRLRPILMTTFALIAGMLPVAMGLNEASKQRTGMGIAIIGGLISSTLLSLVIVPAAFSYIDRFRVWSKNLMMRIVN